MEVNTNEDLCRGCQKLDLATSFWEQRDRLPLSEHAAFSSPATLEHSALSCQLCELFLTSLRIDIKCYEIQSFSRPDSWYLKDYWQRTKYLDLQVHDGYSLTLMFQSPTNEKLSFAKIDVAPHLESLECSQHTSDSLLHRQQVRQWFPPWLTQQLRRFKVEPRLIYPVDRNARSEDALRRVRRWLNDCDSNHQCCGDISSTRNLPDRVLWLGTLQQPELRLLETGGKIGRYIALSYSWGGSPTIVATSRNAEALKISIDEATLPATISDAIFLARRVGIPYLWIDSLCILQDDHHDWEKQSAKMGAIYRDSYVTISASNSRQVTSGFLHQRPLATAYVGTLRNGGEQVQILAAVKHNYRAHVDDVSGAAYCEPLTRRAWTVQERLLSNRVIYYASHINIFECKHARTFESGERWRFNTKSVPTHSKGPITTRIKQPLVLPSDKLRKLPSVGDMNIWHGIVEKYSKCELTRTTDRLPAISGIASLHAQGDVYLAGHWKRHMPNTLVWMRSNYSQVKHHSPRSRGPSWSWSSVDCTVLYNSLSAAIPVATLESHDVPLAGSNPFGEVRRGCLNLTAPLCKVVVPEGQRSRSTLSPRKTWALHDSGPHLFGGLIDFDEMPQPAELFLAVLVLKPRGHGGILLTPEEGPVKTYKRVGAFLDSQSFQQFGLPAPSSIRVV